MLMDYEQELTTKDGQVVTTTAFGTKAYDQKGAGNAGVGEPLALLFKVSGASLTALTTLDVQLHGSDDAAFTNEVLLLTKQYVPADLTFSGAAGDTGKAQTVGILPSNAVEKRFYRVRFLVTGPAIAGGGKLTAWLGKGSDATPVNLGAKT